MNIQLTNQHGEAILTLGGRLDTAVSRETSAEIDKQLSSAGTINQLTVDIADLDYISSSGLRILLTLAKRYEQFKIIEVSNKIYDVFNMTGFTKIMTVERALRQLSIEGCELIGIGGVGTVLLGIWLFGEPASVLRMFFVLMILTGVAGLKIIS